MIPTCVESLGPPLVPDHVVISGPATGEQSHFGFPLSIHLDDRRRMTRLGFRGPRSTGSLHPVDPGTTAPCYAPAMSELPTQSAAPPPSSDRSGSSRTDPTYPGLRQAVVLTCLTALSLLLVGLAAAAIVAVLGLDILTGADTAAVNIIAIGLIVLWGCRRTGAPFSTVLRFNAFPPLLLVPLLLLALGSSILVSEADNLLRTVWPMPRVLLWVVVQLVSATVIGAVLVWILIRK